MDDAREVLSALRLGWSVAEMRGRNRSGGPSGDIAGMPDQIDHPLPLRIERSKTELRIEVQSVLAELAQELRVDDSADGTSLTAALGDAAKLLSHVRAPKAADALQQALDLLQAPSAGQVGQDEPSPPDLALAVLRQGLATQQAVVVRRQQAVAAANRALAGARQHQSPDARHPDQAQAEAESARTAAETAVQLEVCLPRWRGCGGRGPRAGHRRARAGDRRQPADRRGGWNRVHQAMSAGIRRRCPPALGRPGRTDLAVRRAGPGPAGRDLREPGHRLPARTRPGRHLLGARSRPAERLRELGFPARRAALRRVVAADRPAGGLHG